MDGWFETAPPPRLQQKLKCCNLLISQLKLIALVLFVIALLCKTLVFKSLQKSLYDKTTW